MDSRISITWIASRDRNIIEYTNTYMSFSRLKFTFKLFELIRKSSKWKENSRTVDRLENFCQCFLGRLGTPILSLIFSLHWLLTFQFISEEVSYLSHLIVHLIICITKSKWRISYSMTREIYAQSRIMRLIHVDVLRGKDAERWTSFNDWRLYIVGSRLFHDFNTNFIFLTVDEIAILWWRVIRRLRTGNIRYKNTYDIGTWRSTCNSQWCSQTTRYLSIVWFNTANIDAMYVWSLRSSGWRKYRQVGCRSDTGSSQGFMRPLSQNRASVIETSVSYWNFKTTMIGNCFENEISECGCANMLHNEIIDICLFLFFVQEKLWNSKVKYE